MAPKPVLDQIAQARMSGWHTLDLSNQGLDEVPGELGSVRTLTKLDLSRNRIRSLPRSLFFLTALQQVDLSRNALTAIPSEVGDLVDLRTLDLSENSIHSLPDSIGQLKKLKALQLSRNDLENLPTQLGELSLERLYLHGNGRLMIPPDILGPTAEDVATRFQTAAQPSVILGYYLRLVSGAGRPLNEAKLIFLGRGGVGKTSLISRLTTGAFDPGSPQTEGIKVTHVDIDPGPNRVHVHIWDFGGQDIMHATHQFFLTERSVYVLVLSGRQGAEDLDAEYWLRLISSFAPQCPVLVALNRQGEVAFDVNRRGLSSKFGQIRGFVATDCAVPIGIPPLRDAIRREVLSLPHLTFPFPAAWFAIKQRLSGMSEPYLTRTRYREICSSLGEQDPRSQEELARYLHDLGIALSYLDDPRLQHLQVLNPRWVTNGIYKVLNSQQFKLQMGLIQFSDVERLTHDSGYPRETLCYLLGLMERFELCFKYRKDEEEEENREEDTRCEDVYLVPELLPKDEVPGVERFRLEQCLNFQYRYPVLPEGLIPRFIARCRVLVTQDRVWRTGAIVTYGENEALVRADVHERTVTVSVTGREDRRKTLLALIRSDFEKIHGEISKLDPIAMVPIPGYPAISVEHEELRLLQKENVGVIRRNCDGYLNTVDVGAVLASVDVERSACERRPLRVFISYSHADRGAYTRLEVELKLLVRMGYFESWSDLEIRAGDNFEMRIKERLEGSDLFIALISQNYLGSEYCMDRELRIASELRLAIIPIIIRKSAYRDVPLLSSKQALPRDGRPINSFKPSHNGWYEVFVGLREFASDSMTIGKSAS